MSRNLTRFLAVAVTLGIATPSHATLEIQKKAKAAKFPANSCVYCHVEKLPVKDKVTHNERGTFLVKVKAEKKAKEIDVMWLKDFVETAK